VPPRTDDGHSLRENLRRARALLEDAGWTYRDGALRNAKGEPFTVEYLDTNEAKGATTMAAWQRALAKLGITLTLRDVDFALYQERLDNFSFEMVSIAFPGTHFPGSEYADLFGSKAADTPGSGNFAGVKNPAIDALVERLTTADNKSDYLAACRSLDRAVAHGHYLIPAWTNRGARVAYDAWTLERPGAVPPYPPEGIPYLDWPMTVWWARTPPVTSR
jgi:microcin C transport system substrate-binding protein